MLIYEVHVVTGTGSRRYVNEKFEHLTDALRVQTALAGTQDNGHSFVIVARRVKGTSTSQADRYVEYVEPAER